jgi:hypothetical protein
LQAEVSNKTALAATAAQNEAKLQVEVEKQRELITETREEADGLFLSVVSLTDLLNQAKGIERSQAEINAALLRQYADLKLVGDTLGFGPNTLVQQVPPAIDAKVLAVSEKDLIEISVGSDDGVHKGHTMEVYRGTNYLGKVVVLKTEGNKAVAKIMPEYRTAPIRKDDHVTTRLN